MEEIFHNVFLDNGMLYTKNLVPGQRVYGEKLVMTARGELREWNPYRSKLAAAILKGLKTFPFKADSKVLYLGAAQGTTASHVSDIVDKGYVVCVEISPKAMEELVPLAQSRPNIIPVLGDANKPGEYAKYALKVNVIYQDVAQPNQAKILLRNASFLDPGQYALLCIKSRSINSVADPTKVIREELESVSDGFFVRNVIDLEPYHKDHAMAICEKKLS